ncbi:hypothetical protein BATDEDRAFT_34916 [Batrachochytrium dendrobatidis JAM81]|uniref:Solute:sodium symporter (SSS) family transporter n=2 Tax=Batrachochytrium dendrobatidis TaxID=109871 RepID=F4P0Z3_BATDJ|nr:uncharacterized protein BATDEDRAFT_34916 [Batrachochytrium dendrobatidis JAM81]EGF81366.1 hypothetical protein BATDEDRAFT_34916 [Batrachochytrium dendrobatidis JAM81]KAJ8327793.1 hypothetical protein O5D80_004126 [Batrachochytrium dendrobatidis]KAK5669424.1 hypothetical protein QVD99_003819 [Batrachochytrium dendrobatidis]OAJ37953.1 hypothetical protein BDEG_21922 [Batrachochytrium dendrobatidis JEL423]|eukprot:XP_006678041.1 hypothetical protein BATDEDRAFT_34916 [Batrachochytrium dendrobatidis JAM81]
MALLDSVASKTGLALAIVISILFGAAAVLYSFFGTDQSKVDTEFFITARNTQPVHRIAWSFFAGSMGAWVLYGPAAFVSDPTYGTGYLGLIAYALFTGLPLVMLAFMGTYLRKNVPHATSIASYGRWRFGTGIELLIMIIVVLNLGIALLAEYSAIGGIFQDFFGVPSWVPILVVGIVTMSYTATGGLYVSIVTDQWQAIMALVLFAITIIYMGVSFHGTSLPKLPDYLGATTVGWQSFITLGISLISATFFSEAMWQRVWAAESERSLRIGAIIGSSMSTVVVAVFGLGSMLAYWSGRATADDNSNFGYFLAFRDLNGYTSAAILVVVILIAVIMNESAVDSFQNAITDAVVSVFGSFGVKFPTMGARLLVILFNVPIMYIGTLGLSVLGVFLIGNMITTCMFFPLVAGLIPALNRIISSFSVCLACLFSFFSVMVYGKIMTGDISTGLLTYFYTVYDVNAFLTASVSSIVWLVVFTGIDLAFRKLTGREMPNLPFPSKAALAFSTRKSIVEVPEAQGPRIA